MLQTSAVAGLHALHILRKAVGALGCFGEVAEEGNLRVQTYVERCLILLLCDAPLLGCFCECGGGGHGVLGHKISPANQGRVGDEERGNGVVGYCVGLWLAQEVAGYGHANDAAEAAFGDTGGFGEIIIRDGAFQGNMRVDFEVADETQARECLVLESRLGQIWECRGRTYMYLQPGYVLGRLCG